MRKSKSDCEALYERAGCLVLGIYLRDATDPSLLAEPRFFRPVPHWAGTASASVGGDRNQLATAPPMTPVIHVAWFCTQVMAKSRRRSASKATVRLMRPFIWPVV